MTFNSLQLLIIEDCLGPKSHTIHNAVLVQFQNIFDVVEVSHFEVGVSQLGFSDEFFQQKLRINEKSFETNIFFQSLISEI